MQLVIRFSIMVQLDSCLIRLALGLRSVPRNFKSDRWKCTDRQEMNNRVSLTSLAADAACVALYDCWQVEKDKRRNTNRRENYIVLFDLLLDSLH